METYYSILEIAETATEEQIKQAYRLLVQVWHPDRFQHNPNLLTRAEQKTKEFNAAFDTLSNHALKQRYDEGLRSRRPRQEQHKPKQSHDGPRTTRCPNPVCESVLRVNTKTVGIVTCPSCRTTFRYDPERNEKWDVKYPGWHGATEEGEEKPDPHPKQSANTTPQAGKFLTSQRIIGLAIVLVFAVVAVLTLVSIKPATTDEKEKLPRSGPLPDSVSLDEREPLAVKEEDRVRRAGDSIGFPLENGDELVPAIFPAGEGRLMVVNETALDAVVKLVEEGRGSRLLRYWFIESKKAVALDDLGPCDCSLYFGLGKEWDHNTKKFRLSRSYGKYKEPLTFTETKTPNGISSKIFTVRLEGDPGALARTQVVDEVNFNELF